MIARVSLVGFVFGMGRAFDRLNAWVAQRWHHPEPVDFVFELVLGLALLIAGLRIAEKRQAKQEGRQLASGVSPAAVRADVMRLLIRHGARI